MITAPDWSHAAGWIAAGAWLVGATFLWTGAVKTVAPHVFREHMVRLGWVPTNLIQHLVPVIAGLETAWGVALILGVFPAVTLPATAALLVALTVVSWWGVKSGRTTDCGCYGGYVVPSIAQSVMLNGAFIALVVAAWLWTPVATSTAEWKLVVTASAGIVSGALAAASLEYLWKHGRMLIETSPLKVGRRWSKRWGATPPDDGREMLVSYLGPDCPHCKNWVRVLNAVDQSPGLPRVSGIVSASQKKLDEFIQTSGIRFPVTTIPHTLMSRLVWGVPTTVLVSSGVIENQWGGTMPPEFFHRFRRAFFPRAEDSAGGLPQQVEKPQPA